MFKTIFLTILLPHLMLALYCLGWAMFVFWPVCTLLCRRGCNCKGTIPRARRIPRVLQRRTFRPTGF